MKSVRRLNQILRARKYCFKALKWTFLLANTKPFFWENDANLETLQNFSPYIWVSYKFLLQSVNSLNRIFWTTGCLFKALKCQVWLTNTKPVYWESEANIETFEKVSLYIWVSYKFVLKSGKKVKLNILSYGILVQGFEMQNVVDEYKTIFLGKRGTPWNSPNSFSLYLSFK